jgi:hypothetical protein
MGRFILAVCVMVSYFEHVSKPVSSIKCLEYLECLSDTRPLKKD